MRRWTGLLLAVFLGCQGLRGTPSPTPAPSASRAAEGMPASAPDTIRAAEPAAMPAAADPDAALLKAVSERPDHLPMRADLGELLFRNRQWKAARTQFELLVAHAQEAGPAALKYLIQGHSRLVEIAEEEEDEYARQLHRGMGLYRLACAGGGATDSAAAVPADALYCRAAEALQDARLEQPNEARPHWYLYQIWESLGQHASAITSLRQADAYALLSNLSPRERCELQMACLRHGEELRTGRGR